MRPYIAIEIDGVLSPYDGPPPAGHSLHDVEAAAWQEWAAMVYPRPRRLRLALDAGVGRALAGLPADLVLVSSYTPGELGPLLPALGWETVPPLVPMRHTSTIHYMRVEDPGRSPDAAAGLHWRTKMALAQAVPVLPEGPGWWYEPKYDGHRTVLRRTDETVVLHARSGRVATQHRTDLAVTGMTLRPGTVLDGEAVIWRNGRLDFAAAQSRAASSTTRARALAARHPASYICWDVLQHPDPQIGDCRHLPYTERRAFLLELLADVGPPVQATPATGRSPCSGTTPCASRASRGSSANAAVPAIRRVSDGG